MYVGQGRRGQDHAHRRPDGVAAESATVGEVAGVVTDLGTATDLDVSSCNTALSNTLSKT